MKTLFIPVILGTGREGRRSEHVARFVLSYMQKDNRLETELMDVRDYPSPFTARVDKEGFDDQGLASSIKRADGFVIVSPEYNHGYPGELKIFLDHYFSEFSQKPFGICGVSSGSWAGARMIEGLRIVLAAFNSISIGKTAMFPNVSDLFDEQGNMKEEYIVQYEKMVAGMLDSVITFAEALAPLRTN